MQWLCTFTWVIQLFKQVTIKEITSCQWNPSGLTIVSGQTCESEARMQQVWFCEEAVPSASWLPRHRGTVTRDLNFINRQGCTQNNRSTTPHQLPEGWINGAENTLAWPCLVALAQRLIPSLNTRVCCYHAVVSHRYYQRTSIKSPHQVPIFGPVLPNNIRADSRTEFLLGSSPKVLFFNKLNSKNPSMLYF